jgi:hypothetical protein
MLQEILKNPPKIEMKCPYCNGQIYINGYTDDGYCIRLPCIGCKTGKVLIINYELWEKAIVNIIRNDMLSTPISLPSDPLPPSTPQAAPPQAVRPDDF